ncbi:hypothetical protein A2U01_0105989, partial [Trifolium medium]|nr:hypothetical protein [Trifolium medium]
IVCPFEDDVMCSSLIECPWLLGMLSKISM